MRLDRPYGVPTRAHGKYERSSALSHKHTLTLVFSLCVYELGMRPRWIAFLLALAPVTLANETVPCYRVAWYLGYRN